jgi:hypothetical protein
MVSEKVYVMVRAENRAINRLDLTLRIDITSNVIFKYLDIMDNEFTE